jgi:hypothetical protein
VVREVYVAAIDAEARDKTIQSMLGQTCRDYLLLRVGTLNLMGLLKYDPPLPNVGRDNYLALMEHV